MDPVDASLALAGEASATGDAEGAIVHLSAALRELTATQEVRRAAMVAAQLGELYAYGLGNMVASRAWHARARRLIDAEPPCIEQGWIAIAAMGCDVDDPATLRAAAELALERARQFGDVNLETKALADAGLALVQLGRLDEGMAMLDEAMALVCGPADDVDAASKSVCSFFAACAYALDFERAGSWAELLRQHGVLGVGTMPGAVISGHCESVRAALLVELGRWSDAEDVLSRAHEAVAPWSGGSSWHPDIGLADLRIRQGRTAEAEALLLGKDQSFEALLPAARLHLARGDHDLAAMMARRGMSVLGTDRLRIVVTLTILVDAELARGDLAAAQAAAADLQTAADAVSVAPLQARAAAARARVLAAASDLGEAIGVLEAAIGRVDPDRSPYLRVALLLQLADLRDRGGDRTAACADARTAARALEHLDVSLSEDQREIVERLCTASSARVEAPRPRASLARSGTGWLVSCDGLAVLLPDTKGIRYLVELVGAPGVERHALDLVDRVEGAAPRGAVARRDLDRDAGAVLDDGARRAYRHRIEVLRLEAEQALAAGDFDRADRAQEEVVALVGQLAQAFGLGGRARAAGSVAEKARLNVTRAIRTAIAKITEAVPAGAALDRAVRTGLYCVYEPVADDVRWIVQPGVNGPRRR